MIITATFGGEMFNVEPLTLGDWLRIVVGTSVILWVGEVVRWVKSVKTSKNK